MTGAERAPYVSAMNDTRGRGREAGRPVALLTIGFRPFYLLAGAFAGVALPVWHFAPGELLPAEPYLAAPRGTRTRWFLGSPRRC